MSVWLVIALRSREVQDIQMEMLRKMVWFGSSKRVVV